MKEIKLCCERLGNSIYGGDKALGLTIDDYEHRDMYKYSVLKPSGKICALADSNEDQHMALFDIRFCPFCGCKLEIEENKK